MENLLAYFYKLIHGQEVPENVDLKFDRRWIFFLVVVLLVVGLLLWALLRPGRLEGKLLALLLAGVGFFLMSRRRRAASQKDEE